MTANDTSAVAKKSGPEERRSPGPDLWPRRLLVAIAIGPAVPVHTVRTIIRTDSSRKAGNRAGSTGDSRTSGARNNRPSPARMTPRRDDRVTAPAWRRRPGWTEPAEAALDRAAPTIMGRCRIQVSSIKLPRLAPILGVPSPARTSQASDRWFSKLPRCPASSYFGRVGRSLLDFQRRSRESCNVSAKARGWSCSSKWSRTITGNRSKARRI